MTETTTATEVQRSLRLDLITPDDSRQAVLDGIRRYRHACREMYGVLLSASAAGAEITDGERMQLKPSNDRAAVVLAAAMGRAAVEKAAGARGEGVAYTVGGVGKALGYEMRAWFLQSLYPSALSFVWDSARRDVATVWASGDPEFPKAKRGWLALQGARGVAQFQRRGIGFPRATARPRLENHTLTLNWDRALGAIEFKVPRLDGGRYAVWRRLRDGEEGWQLGTLFLSERDGETFATVTYSRPAEAADVDPAVKCRATFHPDGPVLFTVAGNGQFEVDTIDVAEAEAFLRQALARRTALEARRAACGNPRRPWGHRKGWLAAQDVLSRATLQRERGVADRNHAWSRRIVTRAASWGCGTLTVSGLAEGLRGHSWNWTQFKADLAYKAEERGITVVWEEQ